MKKILITFLSIICFFETYNSYAAFDVTITADNPNPADCVDTSIKVILSATIESAYVNQEAPNEVYYKWSFKDTDPDSSKQYLTLLQKPHSTENTLTLSKEAPAGIHKTTVLFEVFPKGSSAEAIAKGTIVITFTHIEVQITTEEGVEIEQGEAYTMSGVINPDTYVKKWYTPDLGVIKIDPSTGRITFETATAEKPISLKSTFVRLYAEGTECFDSCNVNLIPFSRPGDTAYVGDKLISFETATAEKGWAIGSDPKTQNMGFTYSSVNDKAKGRYKYIHTLGYSGKIQVMVGSHPLDRLADAKAAAAVAGKLDNDWPVPAQGVAVELKQSSLPMSISLGFVSFTPSFSTEKSDNLSVNENGIIREDSWQSHLPNEPIRIEREIKISAGCRNYATFSGWAISSADLIAEHKTKEKDIIEWKPREPAE